MNVGDILATFRVVDQASGPLNEISGKVKQVETAAAQMSGVMKGVLVGAAVSAAYGVGALVVELVQMSDQIKRISDRTGLSIKAVQELGFIAEQSGNSIDQMTTAIGQMQNRLASGDKSAVAAVKMLGLDLKAIMDLAPDEQFYALAEAIGKIPDPMQRTQLAMDLFGRAGAAILPTIIANIETLRKQAPVLADNTVESLDRMGDAWARLKLTAKVTVAEAVVGLADYANAFVSAGLGGVIAKYQTSDLAQKPKGRDTVLRDLIPEVTDYTVAVKASAAAMKTAAAESDVLYTALDQIAFSAKEAALQFRMMDGVLVQVIPDAGTVGKQFEFMGWALEPIVGRDLPTMIALLPQVAEEAKKATGPIGSFFDGIKRGAAGLVDGLTGGQGLMGFFSNIGFGITQALGNILTSGITQLINWGISMAWKGIQAIGKMFSDWFGPGQEWTDVKSARSAFEAKFGGYEGFMAGIGEAYAKGGRPGTEAEAAILAFWNAKTMAELTATMQVLIDAMAGKFGSTSSGGGFLPGEYNPNDPDLPSYAKGTNGFVNFGAGTLAMLHGREAVVPAGQGVGGTPTIIHNYILLDGKEVARNQVRYLPSQLTLAGR